MAVFKPSFEKTVKAEGGYVNDPNDAGGETYLGISRKAHPNSKMWDIIDPIKKQYGVSGLTARLKQNTELDALAEAIYKKDYWDVARLDEVNSQKIAHQIFDMGVNAGMSRGIKLAQKLVNMSETGKVSDELITKLNEYTTT